MRASDLDTIKGKQALLDIRGDTVLLQAVYDMYTMAHAARLFEIGQSTLTTYYREAGVKMHRSKGNTPRRRIPKPARETIKAALALMTIKETAQHFGVSRTTITTWLREEGLSRRNKLCVDVVETATEAEVQEEGPPKLPMERETVLMYIMWRDADLCPPECPGADCCLVNPDAQCYFGQEEIRTAAEETIAYLKGANG